MIALILYVLLALAFLVIAACLVVWVIQREPAGHGQHAGRRTMVLEYDELPCFQPDPALAVATLHNPYALEDAHRDWKVRALDPQRDGGGLAAWVELALSNVPVDETAVDHRLADDTRDAWETGTADDPFEGYGSAEGWVKALFAGKVQVAA